MFRHLIFLFLSIEKDSELKEHDAGLVNKTHKQPGWRF